MDYILEFTLKTLVVLTKLANNTITTSSRHMVEISATWIKCNSL